MIENKVYIFGGKSNGYRNDIHCANITDLVWGEVEVEGEKPTPRYGQSSVVHNGKWYIFGGYENSLSTTTDELWQFEFGEIKKNSKTF